MKIAKLFAAFALVIASITSAPLFAQDANCSVFYAGQHMVAGSVCVTIDDDTAYLDYILENGWTMSEAHAWIGEDLADMPQNKKGNPRIGHFPYSESGLNNLTHYSVAVPISELPVNLDTFCEAELFVAAHAVVQKAGGSASTGKGKKNSGGGTQTAWAGESEFTSRGGSWAAYFSFTNDFCQPTEIVVPEGCYNTFASGTGQERFGMLSNTAFTPVGVTDLDTAWITEYSNNSFTMGLLLDSNGLSSIAGFTFYNDNGTNKTVSINASGSYVYSANVYYGPVSEFQNTNPLQWGYHADNTSSTNYDLDVVLPSITDPTFGIAVHAVVCESSGNQ